MNKHSIELGDTTFHKTTIHKDIFKGDILDLIMPELSPKLFLPHEFDLHVLDESKCADIRQVSKSTFQIRGVGHGNVILTPVIRTKKGDTKLQEIHLKIKLQPKYTLHRVDITDHRLKCKKRGKKIGKKHATIDTRKGYDKIYSVTLKPGQMIEILTRSEMFHSEDISGNGEVCLQDKFSYFNSTLDTDFVGSDPDTYEVWHFVAGRKKGIVRLTFRGGSMPDRANDVLAIVDVVVS